MLHFGQHETQFFGVAALFAATLHPGVGGAGKGGFFKHGIYRLVPGVVDVRQVWAKTTLGGGQVGVIRRR